MIVIAAFNLELAAAVAKLMREKKAKVRYIDAAVFTGEREDGTMVFLQLPGDAKHQKADELKAMPGVRVAVVQNAGDVAAAAKAIANAAANVATPEGPVPAKADKPAEHGKNDPPAAPPPDPGEPGMKG